MIRDWMTTWKKKSNALEQYGTLEMLEITGIPHKDREKCIHIIHNQNFFIIKILLLQNSKLNKCDFLYSNKLKLKKKSIKDMKIHIN